MLRTSWTAPFASNVRPFGAGKTLQAVRHSTSHPTSHNPPVAIGMHKFKVRPNTLRLVGCSHLNKTSGQKQCLPHILLVHYTSATSVDALDPPRVCPTTDDRRRSKNKISTFPRRRGIIVAVLWTERGSDINSDRKWVTTPWGRLKSCYTATTISTPRFFDVLICLDLRLLLKSEQLSSPCKHRNLQLRKSLRCRSAPIPLGTQIYMYS